MTQEELLDELSDIFAGLRDEEIRYTPQKNQFAFHTLFCEKNNDAIEDIFGEPNPRKKLDKEKMKQLKAKAIEIGNRYNINVEEMVKMLQEIIDKYCE